MNFDLLNDITFKKQDLPAENPELLRGNNYSKFLVELMLSRHMDTILFAEELNERPRISNRMHFYYLFYAIPKKKRFAKGTKSPKIKNLDLVKQYYNYSDEKALDIMDLLSEEDIEYIKKSLYRGGK